MVMAVYGLVSVRWSSVRRNDESYLSEGVFHIRLSENVDSEVVADSVSIDTVVLLTVE